MLAYWNGRFLPAKEIGLSIADAGLVFAATVTDFCRTYQQKLFRWPQHVRRFLADCEALHLRCPLGEAELTSVAHELVERNRVGLAPNQELALNSFATLGPLNYLLGESGPSEPTLVLHMFPLNPTRYEHITKEGATLELVGVLPDHPAALVPVSVKHRNRLHWHFAHQRRRTRSSVSVLVNSSFTAPDTAIGSVLHYKDGCLYRSLPGTVLASISVNVLEECAQRLGVPVVAKPIHWPELLDPEGEVFLVGSGFGLVGVRRLIGLNQEETLLAWPGPMVQRFQAIWQEITAQPVD